MMAHLADGDYDFEFEHDDSNSSSNYSYYDDGLHGVCDKASVRGFAGAFLPCVYALALVVGLAGNALVVCVYVAEKRLRTVTDVCVLNLALADLLLLLTLPLWAADAVNGWQLGVLACKLTSALYSANFSVGMLLLACISVDRYRALAPPRRPSRPPTCPPRLALCVCVWASACLLGLPDLLFSTVTGGHGGGHKVCRPVYPPGLARAAKASLEVGEVALSFAVPAAVMLACYCRVGRTLWRAQGGAALGRSGRRWRAFRVLALVVGVFLGTQLPYAAIRLARALDSIFAMVTECDSSKALDRAAQVTESLALTHACVNPLLYATAGSSFRSHTLALAKRCGRRYRHANQPQPAVEIALNSHTHSHTPHTHSRSEDEDTSTFSI